MKVEFEKPVQIDVKSLTDDYPFSSYLFYSPETTNTATGEEIPARLSGSDGTDIITFHGDKKGITAIETPLSSDHSTLTFVLGNIAKRYPETAEAIGNALEFHQAMASDVLPDSSADFSVEHQAEGLKLPHPHSDDSGEVRYEDIEARIGEIFDSFGLKLPSNEGKV